MLTLRAMTLDDYDGVLELMKQTPGISVREADSRAATARYLARNPGLSFVALASGALAGFIMSGHDGRRGYLQHLLVLPPWRRQGLAAQLVQRCLLTLAREGIGKSHVDVLKSNGQAAQFWRGQGWQLREDIDRYSWVQVGGANA